MPPRVCDLPRHAAAHPSPRPRPSLRPFPQIRPAGRCLHITLKILRRTAAGYIAALSVLMSCHPCVQNPTRRDYFECSPPAVSILCPALECQAPLVPALDRSGPGRLPFGCTLWLTIGWPRPPRTPVRHRTVPGFSYVLAPSHFSRPVGDSPPLFDPVFLTRVFSFFWERVIILSPSFCNSPSFIPPSPPSIPLW